MMPSPPASVDDLAKGRGRCGALQGLRHGDAVLQLGCQLWCPSDGPDPLPS
jgi:hypothetical protein